MHGFDLVMQVPFCLDTNCNIPQNKTKLASMNMECILTKEDDEKNKSTIKNKTASQQKKIPTNHYINR